MKKLISPLMQACALCLMHVVVYAQTEVKKRDPENALAFQKTASLPNNMASFRNIPIKAVRSFKTAWQYVDNEIWYEVPDGYRARFTQDGVLYLVTYNRKGRWLHTIRQYDETRLAREVRSEVKTVYYDYNIILVEEIELPMQPLTYVVHMEDASSFLNVRICNREMEVMTRINKL